MTVETDKAAEPESLYLKRARSLTRTLASIQGQIDSILVRLSEIDETLIQMNKGNIPKF